MKQNRLRTFNLVCGVFLFISALTILPSLYFGNGFVMKYLIPGQAVNVFDVLRYSGFAWMIINIFCVFPAWLMIVGIIHLIEWNIDRREGK